MSEANAQNIEELRVIIEKSNGFLELGSEGLLEEYYDFVDVLRNIDLDLFVIEDLGFIKDRLNVYLTAIEEREKVTGETDISVYTKHLIQKLKSQVKAYEDGRFIQRLCISPETPAESLEPLDIHTFYKLRGISSPKEIRRLHNVGVSRSLVEAYDAQDLLRESVYWQNSSAAYELLAHNVPANKAKDILHYLLVEEKEEIGLIPLSDIAKACATGKSSNFEFIIGAAKRLHEIYNLEVVDSTHKSKSLLLALDEVLVGSTQQKLRRLRFLLGLGLESNVAFYIAAKNIDKVTNAVGSVIHQDWELTTSGQVYWEALKQNDEITIEFIDHFYAKSPYQSVSLALQDLVLLFQEFPNLKISELLMLVDNFDGSSVDRVYLDSLDRVIREKLSPARVQKFIDVGISNLNVLASILEFGVPPSYLKKLSAVFEKSVLKDLEASIAIWYYLKISVPEIEKLKKLNIKSLKEIESKTDLKAMRQMIFFIDKNPETENYFSDWLELEGLDIVLHHFSVTATFADIQYAREFNMNIDLVGLIGIPRLRKIYEATKAYLDEDILLGFHGVCVRYLETKSLESITQLCQDYKVHIETEKMPVIFRDFKKPTTSKTEENQLSVLRAHLNENAPGREVFNFFATADMLHEYLLATNQYALECTLLDFSNDQMDEALRWLLYNGHLEVDKSKFLEVFNISFPTRYPSKILEDMYARFMKLETLEKGKKALWVSDKTDWNRAHTGKGAYRSHKNLLALSSGHEVECREAGSVDQLRQQIIQSADRGKIDVLVINAHGNGSSLQFGYDPKVNKYENLNWRRIKALKGLGHCFSDDSKIIISACSVANEKGLKMSIAQRLLEVLAVETVHAPVGDCSDLTINIDDTFGKVTGVKFNVPHKVLKRSN